MQWRARRRFWEGTWARLDLAAAAAKARRRGEAARLVDEARLVLAPKTISAHIAHILAKLGAARRAEIAAWCATIRPQR